MRDLKNSNIALKEIFQNLYFEIAEEAMMGFITFSVKTGCCVYANKLARELLELTTLPDISEFHQAQLYPGSEDGRGRVRLFDADIAQLEGLFQDVLVQKINRHNFIAHIGIKKVQLQGEQHLLIMLQDMTLQNKLKKEITEKQNAVKSAYEEVLNQNRKLKELDTAKDKFIALTTHELRTPLSAMFGSAEILKLGLYDGEAELKEFIDMIYDQGQHLMELVNDILDFAKARAGRMDYFIEKADLTNFLKSELDSIESMAMENQIKLDFRHPGKEQYCYYDPLRLRQITQNILSNAIKYNRQGGSVIVWIEERPNNMRMYCQDTGMGIDAKDINQVFNEFETLGKVALHHKGTGLGMPITKKLIEGMGGTINLISDVGVGTTFYIDLPTSPILDESMYRVRSEELDEMLAV